MTAATKDGDMLQVGSTWSTGTQIGCILRVSVRSPQEDVRNIVNKPLELRF